MPRSRHAVRAAEIELDAVAVRLFDAREDRLPGVLVARHHQRDDQSAIAPGPLDLLDLLQIDLEIAVGDEFDVVERDQAPVRPMDRAVARARDIDDRRSRFAERLPHDAAPAGAKGALDVDLAVGRRRRGEPERVGRFDAEEIGAKISHGTLALLPQMRATPSAAAIDRAACLPSSTALTVRSSPAEDAVAASPHAFEAGAALVVDDDAAVLHVDLRPVQRLERSTLADGGEHHVGFDPEDRAGRGERAVALARILENDAAQRVRRGLRAPPGAPMCG